MRRTESMAEVEESLLQGQFQLPLKRTADRAVPGWQPVSHLFWPWSFLWWWRRREAVSRWPWAAAQESGSRRRVATLLAEMDIKMLTYQSPRNLQLSSHHNLPMGGEALLSGTPILPPPAPVSASAFWVLGLTSVTQFLYIFKKGFSRKSSYLLKQFQISTDVGKGWRIGLGGTLVNSWKDGALQIFYFPWHFPDIFLQCSSLTISLLYPWMEWAMILSYHWQRGTFTTEITWLPTFCLSLRKDALLKPGYLKLPWWLRG